MVDYYSVGYSLNLASLALLGGFFGGGIFFFLNQLLRKDIAEFWRYFCLALFTGFFVGFWVLFYFLSSSGLIYINYSRSLPENNQVLINLSCVDEMNCSATIPNQLQISCPEQNCPSQKVCPTLTPIPIQTHPPPIIVRCPWSLSIP